MITGSSLIITGGKKYQLNHHLSQVGVQTEAYVHSIDKPALISNIHIGAFSHQPATHVTICFQDSSGKWVAARLQGRDLSKYIVGDKLTIRYDLACPTDCLIDYGTPADWSAAGAITLLLLGFGLLGYGLYEFLVST